MNKWETLPEQEIIDTTVKSLSENGFNAVVVANGQEAKEKALALLPKDAEVMTMTSTTLDTISLTQAIDSSSDYNAVKPKLMQMDRNTQSIEMQKVGSAPEWAIGSAHAVTQDGHVIIASNTGSQLPAYAYGSAHVIWVVGAQKIVKNFEEGLRRLYEHTLPLESERAKKAYGVPGSAVNKLLVINKEVMPGRVTIILVKESLGF